MELNCAYAKERTIFDAVGTIEDIMEFSEGIIMRGE